MNRNLWLPALCQGLFLTNNTGLTAIKRLVALASTLPCALAVTQRNFWRKTCTAAPGTFKTAVP
ncbi:MAG: hypothetical protein LBH10_01060 [Burkholderiaceae bacterium]|jgi:hypothetical protein|nr:hypothetical protein [Burkholderiaceae bacterium]